MHNKPVASTFRRHADTVYIGDVAMGGDFPVRIQSMINTLTRDIDGSVEQCKRIIGAGADYVRITVPSPADVENLAQIKEKLRAQGYNTPLIADVHFNTTIALKSAAVVEKVRINPGNFGISGKFRKAEYSPEEYNAEWNKQKKAFLEFLDICRKHNTAIRIGINHGSLSDRIMSRYGDTAEGMVESALEFLRVCKEVDFRRVVISMKASNTLVMIYATRLLVKKMNEESMGYPLHLGVTEAGEGEDGRIKSAVGIGTLMAHGIGDTIRVSLTEEPEAEIPVAQKLVSVCEVINRKGINGGEIPLQYYEYERRKSSSVSNIGGRHVPVVITTMSKDTVAEYFTHGIESRWKEGINLPDFVYSAQWREGYKVPEKVGVILPVKTWLQHREEKMLYPLYEGKEIMDTTHLREDISFLRLHADDLTVDMMSFIKEKSNVVVVASADSTYAFTAFHRFFSAMASGNLTVPVILAAQFSEVEKEDFQLKAAVHMGGILVDGSGDGLWLSCEGYGNPEESSSTAFGILQATRTRITKTEFIACPSCGRTNFNLMETLAAIKARTSHLKGLKIGVMGCIVNGPGEMADADYGYVGSGKGKVTLYKAKTVVKHNIPEALALDELIKVIKENGDWKEE
ncbi:MAG: (E)-4-hydroxy-3-methylbut-2-enyl-diphosphate synthase [Bacteroidales bacterium]|nr:(E)-4-hydroxy-3-methylbut-2-enyl-diphosphate synthase [Bacteroidales bacterium]MBN2763089.1 (E)-4-hydroxy-3-methylbut-2-enyl-diphosphate synthase [Bacteroidales bacterium]